MSLTANGSPIRKRSAGALMRSRLATPRALKNADPAWRALGGVYTELAAEKTGRGDVIVSVCPGATGEDGPPGFYVPARAEIGLDGTILPDQPDRLAMDDPEHFKALAVLHGVLIHEIGHAVHTRWPSGGFPRELTETIALLEEIRMEAQQNRRAPLDSRWLRVAARELIVDGGNVILSDDEAALAPPSMLAHGATLVLGRVHAGTLTERDATEMRMLARAHLAPETLAALESIWQETTALTDDGDSDALIELARRYRELFADERAESGALVSAIANALALAGESAAQDALAEILADPDAAEELRELGEIAVAEGEWQRLNPNRKGACAGTPGGTLPQLGSRLPTGDERAARKRLARRLREARWRDRIVTRRCSAAPPGRLRSREALRASVQRERGMMVDAEPWRQRVRRRVEMPRLRVGILCDVSGSMSGTEEGLASSLWVIANAVRDNEGKAAGATFGDSAQLILPAKQIARHVMTFMPQGGTGHVPAAIDFVADDLSLESRDTLNLLVIVSDGAWAGNAKRRIRKLQDAGAKVIQVGIGSEPVDHGADRICVIAESDDLAEVVGRACVDALKAG